MPSFNEITGARISSGVHVKGTDKEKFDSGWDLLWGNKEAEDAPDQEAFKEKLLERMLPISKCYTKMADGCCHKTVLERCEDCVYKEE